MRIIVATTFKDKQIAFRGNAISSIEEIGNNICMVNIQYIGLTKIYFNFKLLVSFWNEAITNGMQL